MAVRVLVTGGAGFVGSALVRHSARSGYEPFVLDLKSPFDQRRWYRVDLGNDGTAMPFLSECDVVWHCAAIADVYEAAEKPSLTARVNVEGTTRLLEAAREAGVRKFLYASTWEVYGRPLYEPVDEAHPCNPEHPYSITKLAGEMLCEALGESRGMRTIRLRLGTAIGPGMRPTTVISRFVTCGQEGRPVTLQGSGSQYRQFTHVRDIGNAFIAATEYQGSNRVFNICSDEKTTILRLAELIAGRFNVPIVHMPMREGEPPSATISSELARRELGWRPHTTLEEGIAEIVNGLNIAPG